MKKGIKFTAAAAMAISALTPVAVFANEVETPVVENGLYTVGQYLSVAQFQALSKAEKKAFLVETMTAGKLAYVLDGKVYDLGSEEVQNAPATELEKFALDFDEYSDKYDGIQFGKDGLVEVAEDLVVESVSAINANQISVTFEGVEGAVTIDLEEALVDGENEVTFTYEGKEYTATVNYEAPDAEAPVLTVDGETTINVENGAEVVLPKVTATDNKDEAVEVTSVITNAAGEELESIDSTVAGTYTVTYSAVDAAGNAAENVVVTVVVAETVEAPFKVESVTTINNNAVTVTFAEVTEAIEDANIVVKDGEGNVVETKPMLLAEGTTQADFEFVTPFPVDHKFTGVWDVNGEKYNFDAINQLADIEEAVKANNEIDLQAALDAAGITYADELRIAEYLGALDADALKSLDAVQEAITKVDEDKATAKDKAAAVKAVIDAETQAQLLAALNANFERVNSAWIVNYSVAGEGNLLAFTGTGAGNEATDFTSIQNAIDARNLAKVTPKVEAANMSLDSAKVTEARTLVSNWIASEKGKVTIKDWALDGLDLEDALIAVNNAKTNSALKSALTNLDALENKLVAKYKDVASISGIASDKLAAAKVDVFKLDKVLDANLTAYREAIAAETVIDDKNQRSDIQQIITDVNESFGSLVAEESKVAASATAKPNFTIKALQKDGKLYTSMANASNIEVKIGDAAAQTYVVDGSNNFDAGTVGELKITADGGAAGFDLSNVGTETEATITFEAGVDGEGNAVTYTVKAPVKVTAGQIDAAKTLATFDLSNVEGTYASGEDVEFTFTLKDAADNSIASENGTYASTITVGTDKYHQNITFVDGKATVKAPARATVTDGDIQVELTTKNNGALDITASEVITIEAGEFSKLEVAQTTAANITITATDGVNTIEDFGTKLVNIKAVKVVGETETPVTVAGTDYQGNLTANFVAGVLTHDTELAAGTYKVTVTVNGVTTTKTIEISA